jgi:uncharacterized protein
MAWSWPWRKPEAPSAPRIEPVVAEPVGIAPAVLGRSRRRDIIVPWTLPAAPPGVIPEDAPTMAQDRDLDTLYGWANGYGGMGLLSEGLYFPGYPYLAELTQRPEYRRGSEIIAKEMTRKFIRLTAAGDDDKTAKLAALDAAFKRYRVREVFQEIAEQDGFFGRSQIYLDFGTSRDLDMTPLVVDPAVIRKGSLRRLATVEPLWTYPADYNSSDPLADDFYKPRSWYVLGRKLHSSRFLTFIGREVPDILKPAYMFGGLSISQIGKPYVDNWLRTRQSVSDLIHSFSVSGLKTNMGATLAAGPGTGVLDRVELMNNLRDNSGSLVLDKDTEEWFNVSTPLGTLDKLQAQAQEHMSSVWGIPLIVFFGITPSGLNASSDGELAVWNDWIEAQQQHLFGANLEKLLKVIQLSEFGEIDPDIGYAWETLSKVDEAALAAVRKSDADVAVAYMSAGVISPLEERTRLAADDDSLYPGLDVEDVPDAPMPDMAGPGFSEPEEAEAA